MNERKVRTMPATITTEVYTLSELCDPTALEDFDEDEED